MTKCLLKLCAHRALDGNVCKAPALRQADYCRHHLRVHRPAIIPAYVFEAATVRDLLAATHRTANDIWTGRISSKLGGQILFEIQKRTNLLKTQLQERQ